MQSVKQKGNIKIKQFHPDKQLNICVPGSKSMTNRALIMAAMSKGKSRLFNVLMSDDSVHCLLLLQKMGVEIKYLDETTIELTSPGIHELQSDEILYIGSAGTTARFLPGLLAASQSGYLFRLDASEQLKVRPIQPLLEKLEYLGANIRYTEACYMFPLEIVGTSIRGGEIEMEGNVSSQFISGLLMTAPYFEQGLKIKMTTPIVQSQYVQITIDMMRHFGVDVEVDNAYTTFYVAPQSGYQAREYIIENDISTAGYFFAMGLLLDTEINMTVNKETLQPDIELLSILEKLGAQVHWEQNHVKVSNAGKIKGNQSFDLTKCSDQALTVGVIAAFADGPIQLCGIGHIRHHESNRLQVLHDNLVLLGIDSEIHDDGIVIIPGIIQKNISIPTHDDHRVAMAFSLVGLKNGDIIIEDYTCTKKTFPQYFQYLKVLGANIEEFKE
ncbi:MAG: 3-phosphoshikimate 1-carboxyvinyltransferase [Culicoidibacterales bacterium]